jgi:hypothetical protein
MNPALRASEGHGFWPGLIVAVAGAVAVVYGARHITSVDTVDGGIATERQLVKAFASSGLQYPHQVAPPPPPNLDSVADPDAAMERWARQQDDFQPPSWKLRVDLDAKAACPT